MIRASARASGIALQKRLPHSFQKLFVVFNGLRTPLSLLRSNLNTNRRHARTMHLAAALRRVAHDLIGFGKRRLAL
jgi:hypothetical protein